MRKRMKDKKSQAYSRTKELILTYQMSPGQRLDTQYLKKEIGVSTTPIREVLNRLVEEGYVRQIKNRGYYVNDLGYKDIENLYEVREALELFAVKKALREGTKMDRALQDEIKQNMDLYFRYTDEKGYRNRLPIDERFHVILANLSGNHHLVTMLKNIFEKINYKEKVFELYPQRGVQASKEHNKIFKLLLARKEEKLLQHLQNHIRAGKQRILSILKAREEYLKL